MNFEFRTKIHMKSLGIKDLCLNFMNFGSCFASSVHEDLRSNGLHSLISPFGISYNPQVIADQLQILCSDRRFTEEDLGQTEDGLYFSFLHHGDFAALDSTHCLDVINRRLQETREEFQRTHYLIITLGTAFVYRLKSNGQAVANCHKQQPSLFDRELTDHKDISLKILSAILTMRTLNPNLQVILTVSPVRHLRDSAFENSQSKAHLLIAANTISQSLEKVHYFPAYEIMMDELRDYRFYARDMSHPSQEAIEYICARFREFVFKETRVFGEIEEYRKRVLHRPRNPDSDSSLKFFEETANLKRKLLQAYPNLSLEF